MGERSRGHDLEADARAVSRPRTPRTLAITTNTSWRTPYYSGCWRVFPGANSLPSFMSHFSGGEMRRLTLAVAAACVAMMAPSAISTAAQASSTKVSHQADFRITTKVVDLGDGKKVVEKTILPTDNQVYRIVPASRSAQTAAAAVAPPSGGCTI